MDNSDEERIRHRYRILLKMVKETFLDDEITETTPLWKISVSHLGKPRSPRVMFILTEELMYRCR